MWVNVTTERSRRNPPNLRAVECQKTLLYVRASKLFLESNRLQELRIEEEESEKEREPKREPENIVTPSCRSEWVSLNRTPR